MKILAIADRGPTINLIQTVESENIDLICTLGDLEYGDIVQLGQITHIPKIGVYGNHCSGTYMEPLGIVNMHLTTETINGLTFGGFEGCLRYKPSSYAKMYTQEECESMMRDFPPVDVFISHSPPAGINDEPDDLSHAGLSGLRKYLDRKMPKYWLHGHTYPSDENIVTEYQGTQIIYVYRTRIIEI